MGIMLFLKNKDVSFEFMNRKAMQVTGTLNIYSENTCQSSSFQEHFCFGQIILKP